jgi:hypothetical protein
MRRGREERGAAVGCARHVALHEIDREARATRRERRADRSVARDQRRDAGQVSHQQRGENRGGSPQRWGARVQREHDRSTCAEHDRGLVEQGIQADREPDPSRGHRDLPKWRSARLLDVAQRREQHEQEGADRRPFAQELCLLVVQRSVPGGDAARDQRHRDAADPARDPRDQDAGQGAERELQRLRPGDVIAVQLRERGECIAVERCLVERLRTVPAQPLGFACRTALPRVVGVIGIARHQSPADRRRACSA